MSRNDVAAFERLLRPLRRELSHELATALARLQADEQVQARYEELAGKSTAGSLSAEEQSELESLVRANSFLGVLKLEARAILARTGTD